MKYWDALRAWILARAAERVKEPEGMRGRIYAPLGKKGTIRARVYRAATGKWEDLGIIGEPKGD